MPTPAHSVPETPTLVTRLAAATRASEGLFDHARTNVADRTCSDGRVDSAAFEEHQHAAHGLAWMATLVEAVRQLGVHAARLDESGQSSALDNALITIAAGETLAQLSGGIAMNQGETVRLAAFGLGEDDRTRFATADVTTLIEASAGAQVRATAMGLISAADGAIVHGNAGLDETLEQFRGEMHRFSSERISPHAHQWHTENAYIPLDLIGALAELGVFGLTVPEDFGGLGLGKESMCVVSEELSRGYIGVGSLGTRSEIAAELILAGGTPEQRTEWLPRIASGETLPTAVFTEPDTGSDLASLKTRAERDGDVYRITGNKTWITHAARADLMTLLARTDQNEPGYRGLSMFLAPKPRGSDADPFPAPGMSGGEIEVLGYRGMKEYEIAFDGFEVPAAGLLGGTEGEGFKQLMQTFESARIQTAARAVGVAQNALDLARAYAGERKQFGKPIAAFPRVADKIVLMAAEIYTARLVTLHAAREKDSGRRCDMEAGMAKLLAARVAWTAADNALQIHGGNGFALEYPISRVLADARILNIFEGAAEIQAQVIARRLLERGN